MMQEAKLQFGEKLNPRPKVVCIRELLDDLRLLMASALDAAELQLQVSVAESFPALIMTDPGNQC